MADLRCDRCDRADARSYRSWDVKLCRECAAEYRSVEQARHHLAALVQPIVDRWSAHWLRRQLLKTDLESCLQQLADSVQVR